MWDYSDKVKDHFLHPRNARVISDANAIGDVGSIICGDALRLMLKVNPETDVIEDAAFQTYGCGSAIASSSALTEMIKGKTLAEAQKITNQQIADYLGGLPPEKMHCSVMGREALDAAVANYHGKTYEQSHDDGELICHCFGVGINKVKKAVWENHLTTVEQVTNYTKAGGGCGSCRMRIEEIIDEVWVDLEKLGVPRPGHVPTPVMGVKMMTTPAQSNAAPALDEKTLKSDLFAKVNPVIKDISDYMSHEGSNIDLAGIDGDTVFIKINGEASTGMKREMTLVFVEKKLSEAAGRAIQVKTN